MAHLQRAMAIDPLHLAADAPLIELYKEQGKATQAAELSSKLNAAMEEMSAGKVSTGKSADSGSAQTAEAAFKNIQVLKGISADQLIPTMRFITASLGVDCSYCHVEDHFDRDDKKPKQKAREMIQMMTRIDSQSFGGNRAITCYSCHRGSQTPVATPAIAGEIPALPAGEIAKSVATLPTADELISKYIHALGGVAAIERITSREEMGVTTRGRESVRMEGLYQDADKQAIVEHQSGGESITVINADRGWTSVPGRPLVDLHGDELDAARMDGDLQFPLRIKQNCADLRVDYPEKVGDQEDFVISCSSAGRPLVKFYFDEQSGLLVRLVRYSLTPLGLLPRQIDYADYRVVDEVKIPFRRRVSFPGGSITTQLEQVRQNIPIDEARFAKRASAIDTTPRKP